MDDPLAEIRAEHRKRLFDRFEKRASAFNTTFGATLVLAVGFVLLVYLPYVGLGLEQDRVTVQLQVLEQFVGDLEPRLGETQRNLGAAEAEAKRIDGELEAATGGAEGTRERIEGAVDRRAQIDNSRSGLIASRDQVGAMGIAIRAVDADLQRFELDLGGIAPGFHAALQRAVTLAESGAPLDGCVAGAPRLVCAARPAVAAAGNAFVAHLRAQLIEGRTMLPGPRAAREAVVAGIESALARALFAAGAFGDETGIRRALAAGSEAALRDAALSAVTATRTELDERARRDEEQLRRLSTELGRSEEILRLLAAELEQLEANERKLRTDASAASARRVILEAQVVATRQTRDQLGAEMAQLRAERDEAARKAAEVARRLERLQTPFGALPVGTIDGILAFPLIVAAGFLVASLLLADAAQLKEEFRRQCRAWDRDGRVLDDEQLALVAPLWFDPARPFASRLALGTVYALPPALALLVVGMMALHWRSAANPLLQTDLPMLYSLLYGVAIVMVAVALLRVATTFARLATPLPSAPTDATVPAIG